MLENLVSRQKTQSSAVQWSDDKVFPRVTFILRRMMNIIATFNIGEQDFANDDDDNVVR